MISTNKVSSSAQKSQASGTVLRTAIKNIGSIPNKLKRFFPFTEEMAEKFSRHLLKNRKEELVDSVIEEFK